MKKPGRLLHPEFLDKLIHLFFYEKMPLQSDERKILPGFKLIKRLKILL